MNINRNNYEEYFLLYADNELSAEERNAVEIFLAYNPDLQEEMQMLQQVVINPERIIFEDKKGLLKPEPIDADMQQQLLLLLDNELSEHQKGYIKSLSKYDGQVRKEWELLQQTKLSPEENIVFADKASLYKKEDGRVIAFRWWRAVAAILIGLGVWGTVSYFNKDTAGLSSTETANNDNNIKPVKKQSANSVQALSPGITTQVKEASASVIKQNNNSNTLPEKVSAPGVKKIIQQSPQEENNSLVQQKETNNLPKPVFENVNNPNSNKEETVNVQPANKENKMVDPAENKMSTPPVYAVNATFEERDDNKKSFASFDDDEEEDRPKKTKLGGFLKQVKRVLERKANIKTGGDNNIKIANVSFAMH